MIGGITIRKSRKRKFILYEALLLTGMATCLFGLFLLFLLFGPDTNTIHKVERGCVRIYGFWENQLFEDNHQKVNNSTSIDQIGFESNIYSPSTTSPKRASDFRTSSIDLDQQLSLLHLNDINSNFIELMVIHSALQGYKEVNHYYPKSLHTLASEYPNNYLSVIPENIHYTLVGDRYVLSYKGYKISSNQNENIELHFYPDANELVVAVADLPLARYATASGKESIAL